jgi:hypothetical protein
MKATMKQQAVEQGITVATAAAAGSLYLGMTLTDIAAIATICGTLVGTVVILVRLYWSCKDRYKKNG